MTQACKQTASLSLSLSLFRFNYLMVFVVEMFNGTLLYCMDQSLHIYGVALFQKLNLSALHRRQLCVINVALSSHEAHFSMKKKIDTITTFFLLSNQLKFDLSQIKFT